MTKPTAADVSLALLLGIITASGPEASMRVFGLWEPWVDGSLGRRN
jgi:hypothetical protein